MVLAACHPAPHPCVQPYEPWYHLDRITGPAPTPPPTGGRIDQGAVATPPDTDGDGVPDRFTRYGPEVLVVSRGDGDLVLILPGSSEVYTPYDDGQPGDLNADGRDELFIDADGSTERYLVPGTVTAGTHLLRDVAVDTSVLPPPHCRSATRTGTATTTSRCRRPTDRNPC